MANPGMRHAYKSTKTDPVDTTLVGATKWNDRHYFLEDDGTTASGTLGDLSYRGASGLITLLTGAQGVLTSAGSGNVPAWSMTPTLTTLTVTGALGAGATSLGGHLTFTGAFNIGDGAGNSPVNIHAETLMSSPQYGGPATTGTLVTNDSGSWVDTEAKSLGGNTTRGFLFIEVTEDDAGAIFRLNGDANSVSEVSDPAGIFSGVAGTGSSINIYWSAGNSRYELQNNRGATRAIRLVRIGV